MRICTNVLLITGLLQAPALAARLSLALGSQTGNDLRMDVLWTMSETDPPSFDLDGFVFRFNVLYPPDAYGQLTVMGVSSLPGWSTTSTFGVGGPFTEPDFAFAVDDSSGVGISGNGTTFTTVVGSVFLRAEAVVTGTQVTFRHNDPSDPLPAAFDGPQDWILRWQEEVTGPFQFDIGSGNPGDAGLSWPYHGFENASPVTVFPPEPSPLALLLLAGLTIFRARHAA